MQIGPLQTKIFRDSAESVPHIHFGFHAEALRVVLTLEIKSSSLSNITQF